MGLKKYFVLSFLLKSILLFFVIIFTNVYSQFSSSARNVDAYNRGVGGAGTALKTLSGALLGNPALLATEKVSNRLKVATTFLPRFTSIPEFNSFHTTFSAAYDISPQVGTAGVLVNVFNSSFGNVGLYSETEVGMAYAVRDLGYAPLGVPIHVGASIFVRGYGVNSELATVNTPLDFDFNVGISYDVGKDFLLGLSFNNILSLNNSTTTNATASKSRVLRFGARYGEEIIGVGDVEYEMNNNRVNLYGGVDITTVATWAGIRGDLSKIVSLRVGLEMLNIFEEIPRIFQQGLNNSFRLINPSVGVGINILDIVRVDYAFFYPLSLGGGGFHATSVYFEYNF